MKRTLALATFGGALGAVVGVLALGELFRRAERKALSTWAEIPSSAEAVVAALKPFDDAFAEKYAELCGTLSDVVDLDELGTVTRFEVSELGEIVDLMAWPDRVVRTVEIPVVAGECACSALGPCYSHR